MLIADTGAIYAFYDADDQYHEGVRKIFNQHSGRIIIPDLILVEIDYLLGKFLGVDAELDFLQDLVSGVYQLHRLDNPELQGCSRLIKQYRDLELGLADASVMMAAETLDIYQILTVDERDFRAVKLGKPLTLLPVDQAP
ncbi:MAG: PIN domain-containing protein [Thiolinea sp.]